MNDLPSYCNVVMDQTQYVDPDNENTIVEGLETPTIVQINGNQYLSVKPTDISLDKTYTFKIKVKNLGTDSSG